MKRFISIVAVGGVVMTLAACTNTNSKADYSYELDAPYSLERTVGGSSADGIFRRSIRK